MEYSEQLATLRNHHPDLAAGLGAADSLESVLAWLERQHLPAGSVDLVAQDEFSYDFLIRLAEKRWLVFGVN